MSRKDFVGLCLALVSAASPIFSACGGSAEVEPSGGRPLSGGPEVGEREVLARTSGIKPGSAVPFTDAGSGEQAVLLRLGSGEFAAYSAVCTHRQCIVAYQPESEKLACPCHGSVFDPANNAQPTAGPAQRPLTEVAIRVEEGKVIRM